MGRVEKIIVTWVDLKNSRHEYRPTHNASVLIFIFSPEASSGLFFSKTEIYERNNHEGKEKLQRETRKGKLRKDRFDILDLLKSTYPLYKCINIY